MNALLKSRCSNIIWLADTNYRIDLDNASVRVYAEDDALDMLLAADQLKYVMDAGAAFSGYSEGAILFRPTYRYDLGTDNYDTSEKMRTPAWTGMSLSIRFPTAIYHNLVKRRSGIIPWD
jgi:synaptojanin